MFKTGKIIKLLAGNAAVFLLIVIVLNLLAAVILDLQYGVKWAFSATDVRVGLPNYQDKATAKTILDEFGDLQTEYVPYVVWSRKPYSGEATTINDAGDRVHAETTTSPNGVVRFIGGSSTWGTGTGDEGTLPARFNALYPNLKVHNHGESGFYSRPELARLINLVNQGEPMDLVIFYDGANDTGKLCRKELGLNGSTRAAKIRRRVHPASETFYTLTNSLIEVINGGFFKRHVFRTTDTDIASRCEEDPQYAREIARTMLNNWKLARAAAAVGGADFLAILQPVASVHAPRVDHLDLSESERVAPGQVYDHVRQLVAAEPEIDWFYDLSDAYDGEQYIFLDHVHVSENGHDIMARRIQDAADPILRRRGIVAHPAALSSQTGRLRSHSLPN